MRNSKLGCFTSAGIIAALITMFGIIGVAFASGSQMFTAGALNAKVGQTYGGVNSHAQITKCSACHAAPWSADSMSDRCAICHTDIAAQMFDVAKLHGAIRKKSASLACRDCHPEHRGAAAALTDLRGNKFPHEALGFSLDGHQLTASKVAFTCADCHLNDIKTFAVSTCDDCHRQLDPVFAQAHTLSYGAACLNCHDGADRFDKNKFSHARFTFKLEGGHAGVPCVKCHVDARALADFTATAQDCSACHAAKDAHKGAFGTNCGACHTPSDWKKATFDHNLSTFKLEGKHVEVKCEQCHVNNVFKGTPRDCYSCHQKDDEHGGKFGTDCAACHNPSNWSDATFDHNRSNFPLTGAHANVKCEQCHQNGQFKGLNTACASCHADPAFHAGAFGNACETCHNTSLWSPARFNVRHPEPRNVEEGGSGITHGGASCRQCHPSTVFQATCTACHDSNNPGGGD